MRMMRMNLFVALTVLAGASVSQAKVKCVSPDRPNDPYVEFSLNAREANIYKKGYYENYGQLLYGKLHCQETYNGFYCDRAPGDWVVSINAVDGKIATAQVFSLYYAGRVQKSGVLNCSEIAD